MFNLIATAIVVFSIIPLCCAAEPSGDTSAPPVEPSVSPVRITTFAPATYVYRNFHGTYTELGHFSREMLPELYGALAAEHVLPAGAPIIIFDNPGVDQTKPYDVQIGALVKSDPHLAGYSVRTLQAPHAASCVVSGAGGADAIGNACRSFYEQLSGKNLTPGNQLQFQWLDWDEQNPANDVFRLSVAVPQ